MRPRVAFISVLACALAACSGTGPPRLGYAPPAEQPAQPGAGYVGQPAADLIWDQLLDRLNQSDLQVDLADRERGVMVARYSGDPAPYVTCGWILLYGGGKPEQIDASGDASFNRLVQGRSFGIGRDLKLDARLVVEIRPEGDNAFVEATSNYVLTKTVSAEARSGWRQARSHEIVSFSSGERGAFSKGTVCQPNGALERTVLDILPPATRVAQRAQPAVPPTQQATIVETEIASDDLPGPASSDDLSQQALASDDRARQPSECTIADKMFCEVLEITDPYRRANEEQGLGLELNHLEGGNPLAEGSGLGLDISLPSYDAYLAVSYFLRDGTVHHVLSGSNRRWPANAREFVGASGLSADQSGSVEMVVAVASDVPLFTSPRPPSEAAESYLADLRARFAEMAGGNSQAQIAATLVVITPAQYKPS
jgi:hypothetical protein